MTTEINNLATLIAEVQNGFQPKYLFFWGHQPHKDGQIGKSCLSQWWDSSFEIDGILYRTAEHYMMAEKARLFGDEESRQAILNVEHPNEAKRLGRKAKGFDEALWKQHRYEIVVQANVAKFGQNEALGTFLTNTQERVLVEASPYDKIWGIGLKEDDPKAQNPEQWAGLNLLGFALMEVRNRL
ncbi:MAG: NADAR family protein [Chloroflexota bacterium]